MRPEQLQLAAVLLGLAANASAAGEIYRCIAGPTVSYQEFPCPADAGASTMPIGAEFPAVNQLERDRLLQREAALDARIIRRAEIDASERIARDDRIARELTLQAQMERERAEAASYYVVGRPLVGRRGPVQRHPWPTAIR
jgi:hypothetical protein